MSFSSKTKICKNDFIETQQNYRIFILKKLHDVSCSKKTYLTAFKIWISFIPTTGENSIIAVKHRELKFLFLKPRTSFLDSCVAENSFFAEIFGQNVEVSRTKRWLLILNTDTQCSIVYSNGFPSSYSYLCQVGVVQHSWSLNWS